MDRRDFDRALKCIREKRSMTERLRAVRWLLEHGGKEGIQQLMELRTERGEEGFGRMVEKFLREKGIIIDLEPFMANDWFDSMVRNIEGFEEVCDLIGYRFVAFSMISGINLKAVNHNPQSPAKSTVEFTIGTDENINEMPLEEFRKTLVLSLLSPDTDSVVKLSHPPTKAEIIELLGVRYYLLAPIYGFKLKNLLVLDPQSGLNGYKVELEKDAQLTEWHLPIFRENLRKLVAGEETREKGPSGHFSEEAVARAEKALEAGDAAKALEHLRDWILFIRSYRMRGGIAQMLEEPDPHFERGLLLTGRAYRLLKRNRISEEVLRFSIQLLPGSKRKATFLYELALIMVSEGRFGEAVGPLRKALNLGMPKALVYPHLGKALLNCDRTIAAFLIFGELNREGLLDEESRLWHEEARKRIGEEIVSIIEEIPPPLKQNESSHRGVVLR